MPQYFGKLHITEPSWSTLGAVEAIKKSDRHLIFQCGESCLKISVLAPNLIRVRMTPAGEFLPRRSWAVAQADETWSSVPFEVKETAEAVEIETGQLRLVVDRNPCRIRCFDLLGQPFAADADEGMGWRTGAVAGWKRIEADEHFYGFGERTGLLDQRSQIRTNWTIDALDYDVLTDNMYQAIPFFMALRPGVGYGIFCNTTFWSQFDLGAAQPGVWRMEAQRSSELDYYIIYGPEPSKILATYTQLTGRMPLPPKWSLGYHQCRWSYESENIVRKLAQEFRDRKIPCDVIHLDIDYMNGYRVFTWNNKRFADPKVLLHDLKQDGFKAVTIVDPGVKYEPEADYEIFEQGLKNDYFIRKTNGQLFHGYVWPDKAVFPDFLRPEVRHWWGNCQKSLTELGVAGIWNDMNEPALDDRPFGDPGNKISFPLDAPQGPEDEQTTHFEVHNLYGLTMAQAAYQGLESLRPERSFVLTRSGYAGIQRWSAVWTGDNQSLWEHLEMSLPMLCNLGLSGVAFVGADIGGFAGNATAELFVRWMQVGMLYPLMRGHSALSTARHEPWVFGEKVEQICREYLELRYRLLPYIYTLFWESTSTGAPILRPLLYHFPNDPKTFNLSDQVMLGSAIMAAPICRPGVEYRAVYLPEGRWYDWWSGEVFEGSTHILASAPLEQMPLYVRAGAIVPMAPVMQYVEEFPLEQLTIKVWQGTGELIFYEDDGKTFEYKNGNFCTTNYRVYFDGEQILVEIGEHVGNWTPRDREIVVELVGVGEQRFVDDGTARILRFSSN